MTEKLHTYSVQLTWTGNLGSGTKDYTGYSRDHEFRAGQKPIIQGSSDPSFRGDPDRWNPEELLLASVAACHKLVYLHLCHDHGISVLAYDDKAAATMVETAEGGGHFTKATLRPVVTISPESDPDKAKALHDQVDALCFIAQSVNFPIHHEPVIETAKA